MENLFRLKGYSLIGLVYLGFCLVFTKIFFFKSKLIRFPIHIRSRGKITGMEGLVTGRSLRIDVHNKGTLHLGKNIQINDNCQISCAKKLIIEDNVLIASKVFITDHDHNLSQENNFNFHDISVAPVRIGKNSWIGNNVSILKGVEIGERSVVGAGSVVNRSFPNDSIIGGVPAKILKIKKN